MIVHGQRIPQVRLYCFPHAGATAAVYRSWKAIAPSALHIIGIDPPGRGARVREPKITKYNELVESTASYVAADFLTASEQDPTLGYAMFGHSFGAMFSFSVGAAVQRAVGKAPLCATLSAGLPPHRQSLDGFDPLTDRELLDKIIADGGTAPELLTNETMANYLVMRMRDDDAIRRQFPGERSYCVDFPLTLLAADDDVYVPAKHVWEWAERTSGRCREVRIPGDHFAAVNNPDKVISIITEEVLSSTDDTRC